MPFGATDPVDPQTWNPYAYVGGSPALWVDPDGRHWLCVTLAAAGLAVDIAGGILAPEAEWGTAWAVSLGLHAVGCHFALE